MKKCSRCKRRKLLTEYYTRKNALDGHQAWCKACMIELSRLRRVEHKEELREWFKEHRKNNKELYRDQVRNYRARHKDRVSAGLKLQWAIESGKMPPAKELICEACGKAAQDYHHPDYSKPLEVVPLCKSCHRRLHGAGL